MVCIDKFLGQLIERPKHIRYHIKLGLWPKAEGGDLLFGLTQPALILGGGVNALDWLVPEGQRIGQGESVLFAITGKILYLEAPTAGNISFNKTVKQNLSAAAVDPYGSGWLFKIAPEMAVDEVLKGLSSAEDYLDILRQSEGFKNPEGLKGGVSGICKAVYSGIREQRIT